MIPLNNLNKQYLSIKDEIDSKIKEIIDSGKFINGPKLKEFEKNFAKYCGKKFCVGTSNGSTALFSVLKCLGIKEGDEVIVPVNSFIATASAVKFCGAIPKFVDVNEEGLIDVGKITEKITNKTKAIIPVHLYGNVCDMDEILKIGKDHNLRIIEDCAQAHGSEYKGKKVPIGEIGCFSFFPAKNLGAFGDGGAVVTSNESLAEDLSMFVNHGRKEKYLHEREGFNFRLSDLQAGILNVKLKYLDEGIKKKELIAEKYMKELKTFIKIPRKNESVRHSNHLFVVKTNKRDELKKFLEEKEIQTGVHYPIPLHMQPVFSYLNHKLSDFPMAERLSNEILSIPIYAELEERDQDKIIQEIQTFSKTFNF
jgi:dTDP-4-amino-4,6-dideoxygalactose transaminase